MITLFDHIVVEFSTSHDFQMVTKNAMNLIVFEDNYCFLKFLGNGEIPKSVQMIRATGASYRQTYNSLGDTHWCSKQFVCLGQQVRDSLL